MIERARAALAAAREEDSWPDLAYVTDEDVARYFARKARWFPADPAGEHPDTWKHRVEDWGL